MSADEAGSRGRAATCIQVYYVQLGGSQEDNHPALHCGRWRLSPNLLGLQGAGLGDKRSARPVWTNGACLQTDPGNAYERRHGRGGEEERSRCSVSGIVRAGAVHRSIHRNILRSNMAASWHGNGGTSTVQRGSSQHCHPISLPGQFALWDDRGVCDKRWPQHLVLRLCQCAECSLSHCVRGRNCGRVWLVERSWREKPAHLMQLAGASARLPNRRDKDPHASGVTSRLFCL